MTTCGELALLIGRMESDGSLTEAEHRFPGVETQTISLSRDPQFGAVVCDHDVTADLFSIVCEDSGWWLELQTGSGQLLLNESPVEGRTQVSSGDLLRWDDPLAFIAFHAAGNDEISSAQPEEPLAKDDTDELLQTLQQPNQRTAEFRLFDQYYPRVLDVARASVRGADRRVFDEEDIANEAFSEFYAGLADGRFSSLKGADELWAMLICITRRRAIDMLRHVTAARRKPDQLRGESLFAFNSIRDVSTNQGVGKGQKASDIATVDSDEEVEHFLKFLEAWDSEGFLAPVARLKLDGRTNPQIAEEQNRSLRAVERAMQKIRNLWQQHSQRNDRF